MAQENDAPQAERDNYNALSGDAKKGVSRELDNNDSKKHTLCCCDGKVLERQVLLPFAVSLSHRSEKKCVRFRAPDQQTRETGSLVSLRESARQAPKRNCPPRLGVLRWVATVAEMGHPACNVSRRRPRKMASDKERKHTHITHPRLADAREVSKDNTQKRKAR